MPGMSMAPPAAANRSPRPFTPPNDVATFRDLLLFEERLKSNAMNLQTRKSRYQLFLLQLLALIIFLLIEVLLPPEISLLAVPYRLAIRTLLPHKHTATLMVHPYFATALLFVSLTTLVLFFASGMYEEKISYANKYVPHANRALRSFNMYLNVRKPPLRSKFPLNPLAFFFPRDHNPPSSSQHAVDARRPRAPSTLATSIPIPSIPPARSPRGELIFSSRVDRAFREGYERHRAAFERRREERERGARAGVWAWLVPWATPAPAPPPPSEAKGKAVGVGLGFGVGVGVGGAGGKEPMQKRTGEKGIVMKQKQKQKRRERSLSPLLTDEGDVEGA